MDEYLVAPKVRLVDRRRGVFVEDVKALPSETSHRARLTIADSERQIQDTRRLIEILSQEWLLAYL